MIILRKKKWLLITVLVFLSLATGCGSSEDSFRQESAMIVATPAGNTVPADTDTVTVVDQILPNSGEPARETPLQERIVIKNATLDIEVEDAREIGAAISGLAEAIGGWVVSSNISSYEGQIYSDYTQGTVTIRVPADEFDMALEQIRGLGLDVRAESITGEDVTDEYVDLNSQLENLRASEDQLRQIMDRASTVNDVLTVRTELERVLGDINVIEGRRIFIF
jgi:hypothetical protein